MPKFSEVRQIAAKVEAVEGTLETLAAADAALQAYDVKVAPAPSFFERNPLRDSISALASIPGIRPGKLTCRAEIRGSGAVGTAPEIGKYIRACGFGENVLQSIAIGAITGGPFVHGETITGGTSGATGRVIFDTVNGAAVLRYIDIAGGPFQTLEVITGGTSSATATSSGAPAAAGFEYHPVKGSDSPSLSMASYEDGVKKTLRGCRGNMKLTHKIGEPAFIEFEFEGAMVSVADAAMLSGITYESTEPPTFLNALLSLDAFSPVISELDFDVQNTRKVRGDANTAEGVLSTLITKRKVVGSFNPEMDSVANHDFFGKWFAGTKGRFDASLGDTAGNRFRYWAPTFQYANLEDQDDEGLARLTAPFQMNESALGLQDELSLVYY